MANYFFPIDSSKAAWGSKFAPSWTVTEQKAASGKRRAMVAQTYPSWVINLTFQILTDEQADTLQGFYCLRKGSLEPFYYKDYTQHTAQGQRLAQNTDGTYQCVAKIGGYVEPVQYVDNLTVYVNGTKTTNYTLNGGKITIGTSGTVTADYEYYFKVHFSSAVAITRNFTNVNSATVSLEVVR